MAVKTLYPGLRREWLLSFEVSEPSVLGGLRSPNGPKEIAALHSRYLLRWADSTGCVGTVALTLWQLPYLDRAARFEDWITDYEFARVTQAFGLDPDVPGEVPREAGRGVGFRHTQMPSPISLPP